LPATSRFRPIGLVVRQEFRDNPGPRAASPQAVRRALYIPGGSALSSRFELPLDELPFPVHRLGPEFTCHVQEIIAADFLIVGGGWSSLSEVMALGKPAVAVPLPGHSEQHFNAELIQRWGLGQSLSRENLVPSLRRQWEEDRWWRWPREAPPALAFDGAEKACQVLLEWLGRRRSRT
jgi:hypothetical protein